jgi:hypothetical protein
MTYDIVGGKNPDGVCHAAFPTSTSTRARSRKPAAPSEHAATDCRQPLEPGVTDSVTGQSGPRAGRPGPGCNSSMPDSEVTVTRPVRV